MAAQPNDVDSITATELALLDDVRAGIDFLSERGALLRGRPYAAVTKATADRFLAIAQAQGTRVTPLQHFIDARAELPTFPAALKSIVALLRDILENIPALRSALFIPAPNLSAFAVAGVELPIVYGSGLLRRTPEPIAVAPWERELTAKAVLPIIEAQPKNAALLLAHRGVVAYSDEPISKLAKFVVSLEESAQLTLNAQLLGGARALPKDAYEQMQQGIAGD